MTAGLAERLTGLLPVAQAAPDTAASAAQTAASAASSVLEAASQAAITVGPVLAPALWTLDRWRHADPAMGLALLMLLALFAGEAVHRLTRLPRAIGPMLVGALASPAALRLVDLDDIEPWKPLLDLAVGVLLFELGTRLQPRWLVHNPWLTLKSLGEALLAGGLVAFTLVWMGAPSASAVLAGIVAMSTSPVITLNGVTELSARGQVTERLLTLCAVNSVLAVLGLKVWGVVAASFATAGTSPWSSVLAEALYALCGSFLLGAIAGLLVERLSRLLSNPPSRALLQLGIVVLSALLAAQYGLSALLALLVAGVVARARMGHTLQVEPQFGLLGSALTLLLFLSIGLLATLHGAGTLVPWVVAIIAARAVGKALAVMLLARPSGLGWRQSAGLALALQPASGLAVLSVGASFAWPSGWATPDAQVFEALLIAIGLLQVAGPAFTHWGLRLVAREGRGADND
jgi:Kef-type K+ transport system membrane component KefB